jgi:hypothetical protein
MVRKKIKTFTLPEANALIPELKKRFKHLQIRKEAYTRLHDVLFVHELVCVAEKTKGFFEEDNLEENILGLEQAIEDLAKDVEAIFDMGCVLRNIEKGQVDFPAVFDGKKIYWSWEQDEPSILYYRACPGKRSERIPIPS